MNLALLMAIMSGEAMMIDARALSDISRTLAGLGEAPTAVDFNRALSTVRMGAPVALSGAKASGSGAMTRVGSVGVVDIWGVLTKSPGDVRDGNDRFGTSYAEIRQGVAEAAADKEVKTILLRMDTPGGAAIPAETVAAEILSVARSEGGKPVVALADGMMASAGYYLGSQASALYSAPSAWIGSIGTRMDVWNFKGLLDRFGISVDTIKSTWAKDIGSPFKAMGEKERAVLQAEIDAFDRQFVAAVMRGRGVDAQTVGQWQQIRGKIGQGAVDAGMADGVVNSAEQLVAMLNASGGPEKHARRGAGMRMHKTGSAGPDGLAQKKDEDQVAAVAAAASAGEPAMEDNVARRMMGIAGIAAGLALLDPEAGGGGGGSATATPSGISQEERNRIAAEASAAALKADRARVNSIRAAAVPFAGNEKIQSLANRAIDEQMTVEQFNAEAMIHLAPATLGPGPAQVGNEPTPTITAGRTQSEKLGGSLALAVMQRQQPQIIQLLRDGVSAERSSREARVAEQVAEYWGFGSAADAVKEINVAKASGLAGLSLSQMALRCVAEHARMDLAQAITRFSDSTELFRAAMQTRGSGGVLAGSAGVGSSDFPELMRNVANKTMMAAFAMKATIWEKICAEGRANDFKTAYMVGVSEIGKFVLTPESAPIPESKPVERRETIAVNKFTNGFSLTYEAMVNDDLGAFLQIPQMIGEMAKYIPDDLLITLLKANSYGGPQMQTDSTKLYDAAHKNVGTGVFNYDNVRALQLLGSKQVSRGPDAVELDVDLSVLLVPTALKMSAVDINTQRYVPGTAGQQNQENTLRGTLDLAWSNRLDTDVRYWMFTRPGPLSAFEVRFLFGQKTPTIAISNLSDLTAQRYDAMVPGVGVAARNWEGTAASTGA